MKFSNFLFPDCRDPERDGVVIDETLREARLSDELGVDVIWLAEHHFDGICAYVDPIVFAGALATSTRHAANRLCGRADGTASSDPPGRATGDPRQHHQGTPDRRARPRLLVQYLRLSGVWHRSSRSPGAAGGGRRHPGEGLDREALRASRPVLGAECSDATAAALHKTSSATYPRRFGRGLAY